MPNPRLAGRYAKSLIDLSTERGQLEKVYADMQFLQAICKQSPEFVNLLRSPIIKAGKKDAIIQAITKGRIGELTDAFMKLLVSKGRESDMPEIINAFIEQYNEIKDIHTVKLTTALPVSDELKKAIVQKVKTEAEFGTVQLEAKVDPALIGGFVLEYNNNLVDASILRDLKDIQKQFYGNVFEYNIR
jgi:F-type H+-transporting ATPase subunit delta